MPPVKIITSTKNPQVKNVLELRERKARDKTGLTIVEGAREITRAREAGLKFREFYACPELFHVTGTQELFETLKQGGVKILETNRYVFEKIAFGERLEGVLAVCEKPKTALAGAALGGAEGALLVVVEGVEKPGNLGAILRTADGAGADAVILTDAATDAANPNVIRASLGTVFSLKVFESSNEATFSFLKERGVKICAALPQAEKIYSDAPLSGPLAIVLGSEQKGLSEFWRARADLKIKIPMRGRADSLNVSATAAILIYEAQRQRGLKT